jgi:hypothetical protein
MNCPILPPYQPEAFCKSPQFLFNILSPGKFLLLPHIMVCETKEAVMWHKYLVGLLGVSSRIWCFPLSRVFSYSNQPVHAFLRFLYCIPRYRTSGSLPGPVASNHNVIILALHGDHYSPLVDDSPRRHLFLAINTPSKQNIRTLVSSRP